MFSAVNDHFESEWQKKRCFIAATIYRLVIAFFIFNVLLGELSVLKSVKKLKRIAIFFIDAVKRIVYL